MTVATVEDNPPKVQSLQDARTDAVVVSQGDDFALLHLRRGDLDALAKKVSRYSDPTDLTRSGKARNEALVSRIEAIRPASLEDLSRGQFTAADISVEDVYWIELWARGGRLESERERDRVQAEIDWIRRQLDVGDVRRFEGVERDIYLLPVIGSVLLQLPALVPEVYEVRPAASAELILTILDNQPEMLADVDVLAPKSDAVVVAVHDTGVVAGHPLLKPLILGAESVVPGVTSPVDQHGHGTDMCGVAGFQDLAAEIATGTVAAGAHLVSIKLIAQPQQSDADRALWPERTLEAVQAAEDLAGDLPLVHNFSVGALNPRAERTSWSIGMDLIAHNNGDGRLLVVAAGTLRGSELSVHPSSYPAINLATPLHDPAQAQNVLTVGGFTRLADTTDPRYMGVTALASPGELSPYSATDIGGARPIKPELVWEAGNTAPDGSLPNVGLETLSIVTTRADFQGGNVLTHTFGTSPAAAAISGMAARVWAQHPHLRPETIRALLVHSAAWTPEMERQFSSRVDLLRSCGYGRPDEERAGSSASNRPVLVVEDELVPGARDEYGQLDRPVHYIRFPMPRDEMHAVGEEQIDLAVTLSFFIEPSDNTSRRYPGARLRWDMQGPVESESDFRRRVNALSREEGWTPTTSSYPWRIGSDTRSRGSVQSDSVRVPAAAIAGDRLVAVYPVLGWWTDRKERAEAAIRYSLVLSVDLGDVDVDVYSKIQARISVPTEIVT